MTFDTGGNRSLYTESITSLTPEVKAAAAKTVARLAGDDEAGRQRVCAALGIEGE